METEQPYYRFTGFTWMKYLREIQINCLKFSCSHIYYKNTLVSINQFTFQINYGSFEFSFNGMPKFRIMRFLHFQIFASLQSHKNVGIIINSIYGISEVTSSKHSSSSMNVLSISRSATKIKFQSF